MRISAPFCVIDRPFVVWSNDIERDNKGFLESVDSFFYIRAVHELIGADDDAALERDLDEDQTRKDVSSLARMLWHHGAETLVMLLGAYVQAPNAVHAYVLKCRTEDAIRIARFLLRGERPAYNRISDAPFTMLNLLRGIHRCAGWADLDDTVSKFERVLREILSGFADERHRWEYNSIKHGLRATHGRFALAVGIEETPGVPAPPENMRIVGYSRDASFFNVARSLTNSTKETSKVNFRIEKVTVAWPLEKLLCELQILSLLLNNILSALRVAAGAPPRTVTFDRPAEADTWWDHYFRLPAGNVPTASMSIDFDARNVKLPGAKDVFASYRRKSSPRQA
jgi:hypothetical protein